MRSLRPRHDPGSGLPDSCPDRRADRFFRLINDVGGLRAAYRIDRYMKQSAGREWGTILPAGLFFRPGADTDGRGQGTAAPPLPDYI